MSIQKKPIAKEANSIICMSFLSYTPSSILLSATSLTCPTRVETTIPVIAKRTSLKIVASEALNCPISKKKMAINNANHNDQ